MSETGLKAGDVVMLKSGGPKMTVETISKFSSASTGTDKAKCSWFDGATRFEGTFESVALEKF